jgi:hypothetical protein
MRERRKHFRVEWNSPAKIYDRHGQFVGTCIVRNFSNGGAKIVGLEQNASPDEFILRITPHCHAQCCHVVRRLSDGVAVKFTASAKDIGDLAQLRSDRSQRRKKQSASVVPG